MNDCRLTEPGTRAKTEPDWAYCSPSVCVQAELQELEHCERLQPGKTKGQCPKSCNLHHESLTLSHNTNHTSQITWRQVAADGVCHGLHACAGRCVEAMAPPRDHDGLFDNFNPTIVIVVAVLGVVALLLCCCCRRGSHVLRQHEARTAGTVTPAPRSPSRRDWDQYNHPPVPALLDQPVPLPRRVPSSKPIRNQDGTVTMLSPTGSGRRVVSPGNRGNVVRTPPPSAPPPSDERDRCQY